jgi:hypothetical protein
MTLHLALAEPELTAGGNNIAGFLADGTTNCRTVGQKNW